MVVVYGLGNADMAEAEEKLMKNITMQYIKLAQSGKYEICVWGAGYLGTQSGLQMLRKREISVDYYCDNNSELWGKEIQDGVFCISPMELQKKKERIICFLMVGCTKVDFVLPQIKSMGIERIVLFDDLFIEEKEVYFPFMSKNQIAIYTCIVGDYDELQEPLSVSPQCDYYLISDKKPEQKTVFQYLDINQFLPDSVTDNTRKNRFCKINAHKIFPQYKYSIYFDGQMQIDSTIIERMDELPPIKIMAMCKNYWSGLYMESMRVILNKRDTEEIVKKQIEQYWLEGMPEDFGSVYCGIMVRQHNHPVCRKLMEDWWEQVAHFSKRDLISFPYVLWKNGYTINDVKTIEERFRFESKYWKDAGKHNQPRVVYGEKEIY